MFPPSDRRLRRCPVLRRPPDRGRDLARDRLEHRRVVLDAELARNRQEQRVRRRDRSILRELAGDLVGLARVAATEAAERAVEPTDLILVPVVAEKPAVEVGGDRHHTATDGDARLARMPCLRPRLAVPRDLLRLELVERHLRVLEEERRAHQVHALLAGPESRVARARAPPDAVAETG